MRPFLISVCLLAAVAACGAPIPVPISETAGVIRPGSVQSGGPVPAGQRGSGAASLGGSAAQGFVDRARVDGPPAARADIFARNFLNTVQRRSFTRNIEYCGYFYTDAAGQIAATAPIPGTLATCTQPAPGPSVFASYHTHGAYDGDYDNEVPSIGDLQGDFSFGIDGYVSTPGGRVWRVEYDDRNAVQVCGLGCVAVDPGFVPRDEAGVRQSYTVNELRRR